VRRSSNGDVPRTLYISNGGGNIATFTINAGGNLALLDIVADMGRTLRGIVISPDGHAAYVVDSDASTVSAFGIDEQGLLTPIGTPVETDPKASGPFEECGPMARQGPCAFGVTIAPDGRSVYVTNTNSHTVSSFRVRPDKTLRSLGDPVPAGGTGPRGLAISPNGRRLYVSLRDNDSVQVFGISEGGMLRPIGRPFHCQNVLRRLGIRRYRNALLFGFRSHPTDARFTCRALSPVICPRLPLALTVD
jgi:6-phosphogluconolactonase (cycloisomerase 2 family)